MKTYFDPIPALADPVCTDLPTHKDSVRRLWPTFEPPKNGRSFSAEVRQAVKKDLNFAEEAIEGAVR